MRILKTEAEMQRDRLRAVLINAWSEEAREASAEARKRGGAKSVTIDQVHALRSEAAVAGDEEQVRICDRAIKGDREALGECGRVIAAAKAASS
jgi:hypothetical protein